MSYEHQTDLLDAHDLYDHELRDIDTEHSHDNHTCSSTCEHHQAVQHIDFMESVEHHEHHHGQTEEHIHSPDCGHIEHQLAHIEIDKPHVHDEHCGHLQHQEAAEHVDRGQTSVSDILDEGSTHHEAEHVHSTTCGHVVHEEATTYVDMPTSKEVSKESTIGYTATDTDTPASSNTHTEVSVPGHPAEQPTVAPEQQAEAKTAEVKTTTVTIEKESKAVTRKVKSLALETLKVPKVSRIEDVSNAPNDRDKTESIFTDSSSRVKDILTIPISTAAPESDNVQIDMALESTDENPSLALSSEELSTGKPLEISDRTDFVFDAGINIDTDDSSGEIIAVPQLEPSSSEVLPEISEHEIVIDEHSDAILFTPSESDFELSDFNHNQVAEELIVVQHDTMEPVKQTTESSVEKTRAYITAFLHENKEVDSITIEALSGQLLIYLDTIPEESVEELRPLLEELTELYDLPRLEKFLELYFAGQYQEQTVYAQLFGARTQTTPSLCTRLGKLVLTVLASPHHTSMYRVA